MAFYVIPFLATTFAFGGLLLGGTMGVITKQVVKEKMYKLYGFCGGVLAGLLGMELIPETFSEYSSIGAALGIGIGFLFMILVHTYFHVHKPKGKEKQALQVFIFLSLAICIHNIPTGMALGSALANNNESAFTFMLVIIFHHIPEGLSLMIPFLFTQARWTSFIGMILLLSVVLGLGTMMGGMVQGGSLQLKSVVMGSAIGTLGYVAVCEMLWKAKQNMNVLSFSVFVLSGLLFVQVYIYFCME